MTVATARLTSAQTKLFFHHRLYPGDASYNLAFAFRIPPKLDLERLRETLLRLVRATRAWNTTFEETDDGPRALFHGDGRPGAGQHEVIIERSDETEDQLLAALSAQADRPLPPDRWPLAQARIIQGRDSRLLFLLCSHLAADAYTFFNLTRSLTRLWDDPQAMVDGDADPAALVHDDPASADAITHFRNELAGLPGFVPEALAIRRNAKHLMPGVRERLVLNPVRAARLEACIESLRVSRFSFFLGLHALLLGALTGRKDHVVGVPLANRRGPRQREAFGYFVNTLPLPIDVGRFTTFPDLCRSLGPRVLRLVRQQDFDLSKHAAEIFDGAAPSLAVGNTFSYYKEPLTITLGGDVLVPLHLQRTQVMFPLTLNVEDDDGRFTLHLEYAERFAASRPAGLLLNLIDRLLEDHTALSELGAVGPAERVRIDGLVNRHQRYPVPRSLAAAFQAAVARDPERVAVSDGDQQLSYASLDRLSNQLAQLLLRTVPDPYVAIAMPPSMTLIAVILGILKAGKTYVPLDPKAPERRTRHIVEQFDRLPVIAAPGAFALPDHPQLLPVARLLSDAAAQPETPVHVGDDPGRPAYVIFTSGSTGKPKGVKVTHHNVLRLFAACTDHFDFNADDSWCLFHSYAFDFSVWEIFGALLHGGRLAIVPDQLRRSPADFLEFLCRAGITVLNQTPSAFRQLVSVLRPEDAPRLAVRHVIFGGEALHFECLRPWYALMGDRARLCNMYGITETTVHVTYHALTAAEAHGETVSVIGKPLGDLTIQVVDADLRPCPLGVPGELLVGGAGVALGYLGAETLTAQRFLPDRATGGVVYRTGDLAYLRPDGNIVYIGRIDKQVQLRGHRIELGEVEAALLTLPGVRACAVRLDERPGIEPRLVAYLALGDKGGAAGAENDHDDDERPSQPETDIALRAQLRRLLPDYMIPACFQRLSRLPLTINGKIDETALPLPPLATAAPPPPAAPDVRAPDPGGQQLSREIANIWSGVLQVNGFGFDDNFFDIGGTSMHVAEIHRRITTLVRGADLPMVDLFEHTTVNALSRYLADKVVSP